MHKAIMEYNFNEKDFETGCAIWKSMIFEKAQNQEGLIRMVFLTNKPKALALGIWETKEHAQKFMATGVFMEFLKASETCLAQQPKNDAWEISALY